MSPRESWQTPPATIWACPSNFMCLKLNPQVQVNGIGDAAFGRWLGSDKVISEGLVAPRGLGLYSKRKLSWPMLTQVSVSATLWCSRKALTRCWAGVCTMLLNFPACRTVSQITSALYHLGISLCIYQAIEISITSNGISEFQLTHVTCWKNTTSLPWHSCQQYMTSIWSWENLQTQTETWCENNWSAVSKIWKVRKYEERMRMHWRMNSRLNALCGSGLSPGAEARHLGEIDGITLMSTL